MVGTDTHTRPFSPTPADASSVCLVVCRGIRDDEFLCEEIIYVGRESGGRSVPGVRARSVSRLVLLGRKRVSSSIMVITINNCKSKQKERVCRRKKKAEENTTPG